MGERLSADLTVCDRLNSIGRGPAEEARMRSRGVPNQEHGATGVKSTWIATELGRGFIAGFVGSDFRNSRSSPCAHRRCLMFLLLQRTKRHTLGFHSVTRRTRVLVTQGSSKN